MRRGTRHPADLVIVHLPDGTSFTLHGQIARVMHLLWIKPEGITSLDAWPNNESGITTRLAGKICELRNRYGLSIAMVGEPNTSGLGWHGRYFLKEQVTLNLTQG